MMLCKVRPRLLGAHLQDTTFWPCDCKMGSHAFSMFAQHSDLR
jgi:hypothetical protein